MMPPALPSHEAARLASLRSLNILDTPAEERFDRITRLAQHLLDVPIALISLVDSDRQWFKSKQGLAAEQTPREISICGHAILGEDLFLVPDASLDPRFSDNPLVAGEPRIRFYAGYPLTAEDGSKLGTLCAIDRKPKELTAAQKLSLQDLAAIAENELRSAELNKAMAQLRASQAELVRAKEAAESATRAKSEFLANMSHEIRTPMNAIIGMTELLRYTRLTAKQRGYVETVQSSGELLLTILNDILDFSKMEAGKMLLETRDFSMDDVLQGVCRLMACRAKAKGLKIETFVEPGLPPLKGAGDRLRQVVLNLTSNAVKFTETGKICLRASKQSETETHAAMRIEVADTGIGIPEASLGRLFAPFVQADASTTRHYGGTGLGLAISKKLIELMGGEMGAESRPGKGSTFWCRVIFEKAAQAGSDAGRNTLKKNVKHKATKGFRILVVEDNPVNRKVALHQLKNLGYAAQAVESAAKALKILPRSRYDLVLMDCQMPDMDGYAAAAEIRRREGSGRRIPIVAMTANAMEGDREKCLESGMDDFITKPVKLEALGSALAKWDAALDASVLAGLESIGEKEGEALVREIVGLYLKDAPGRVKALRLAAEGMNADGLAQAAHGLKSASGNVGAKGLQELCGRIESLARSGKTQDAARCAGLVPSEYQRARTALKEKLGGNHGS